MISGGVDVAWVVTPTLSIVASYYYEYYHQTLYSNSERRWLRPLPLQPLGLTYTIDNEFVNTANGGD